MDTMRNPTSQKWLDAYVRRPSAVLWIRTNKDPVAGDNAARYICEELLGNKVNQTIHISLNSDSVGIDEIRSLQHYYARKADFSKGISRIAVIHRADTLTIEAQNALLRLIEEIPERSSIILVSDSETEILPTIRSRCFVIQILPLLPEQSIQFLKSNTIPKHFIDKINSLCAGNLTDMLDIITHKQGTSKIETVHNTAKQYLLANDFNRIQLGSSMVKEDLVDEFIRRLHHISSIGLRNSRTPQQKMKWKKILQAVNQAEIERKANVSKKLVVLALGIRI
jgi:DNA polymerase III delta prime subunit